MTDEPRRVYVGTFSPADTIFIDGVDPARHMMDEANAKLDRMRAEDERQRLAQIADAERARAMQSARIMRRFKRMLKIFARMR
jgi:hypothetical protein